MVNCFQHFLMKSIFQTGISQQQSIQITYHFVYTYVLYIVFLLWKIIAVTLTTKKLRWSENVTFRLKCLSRAYTLSACNIIRIYSKVEVYEIKNKTCIDTEYEWEKMAAASTSTLSHY